MALSDSQASATAKAPRRSRKWLVAVIAIVFAVALIVTLTRIIMADKSSPSTYTAAGVVAPMEQVVADTVETLPNFPGFSERVWSFVGCSSSGAPSEDYVGIQITYEFSEALSKDPLTRETYLGPIRDDWNDRGYTITEDEALEDHYILSASRTDGITMSYWVAAKVVLIVQSGCVDSDDVEEIPYIPPTGGIEPGSEADGVDRFFPDGIPSEDVSTEPADAASSES
jgi:hypothetical protein